MAAVVGRRREREKGGREEVGRMGKKEGGREGGRKVRQGGRGGGREGERERGREGGRERGRQELKSLISACLQCSIPSETAHTQQLHT